jgi:tight adherence protein B
MLYAAGAVIAAVFGYGVYLFIRGRKTDIEERLGRYATVQTITEVVTEGKERGSPLREVFDRVLAGRSFADNISAQLARADLKLTVSEFLAATAIAVVGASAGIYILTKGNPVPTLAAGVIGFFAPRWYLTSRQNKRLNSFNDQLGDTINLLVNSIRSGYSILQAMETVGEEMGPPTSEEFQRVVREVQLGVSMDRALQNLLRRVGSDDLELMITAINVQREVGGNLAEILDSISFTIRERIRILGEVKALTAMGRYSGYLITLLPVGVTILIFSINRDFMMPLFTTACGRIMIGIAVTGVLIGNFVIQRIVKIEV